MSSSLSPCDNETLQQRALAGDAHVLDDLFRCHRQDLTAFLGGVCRTPADAEDALQEAFTAAIKSAHTYRGDGPVHGWLRRIAKNACTRMARSKKNNPAFRATLDDAPLCYDGAARIESLMETRLSQFEGALRALGPLDRRVLFLREGQGLTTAETAAELGISDDAVRSRLYRAKRRVQADLGGPQG